MSPLVLLLATVELLKLSHLPVGTELHVRLTTAVGTYGSKTGTPVRAVLIAPLTADGQTLAPAGSVLTGQVTAAKRVGFGIVHETATLGLNFDMIAPPGGDVHPLYTRLTQVDNGRERIGRNGDIHGVRTTSSMSYRLSGYLRTALQWEVHAVIATWFIRTLILQVPEPEIYYPAGVELTLTLTKPLFLQASENQLAEPAFSRVEKVNLQPILDELPDRSYAASSRPSDLVNVLFIGSRKQLTQAFAAAGWAEPRPSSFRSCLRDLRALAVEGGYRKAQMSTQFINDKAPDISWEKGFNNIAKRHHIRLWRQPETWRGRELWVGAATRDVEFAYFRRGPPMTHKVQQDIDQERDKIVNDLTFTSCVETVDWMDRTGIPRVTHNSTGDPMTTDARLAVIRLNDCDSPRLSTESTDDHLLQARGGKLQRFVRREILAMRSDMMRTNTYYRAYEGARWLVLAIHRRLHRPPSPISPPPGLERAQTVQLKLVT